MAHYYIGLMSGTSLDAIDAALLALPPNAPPEIMATRVMHLPHGLRNELLALTHGDTDTSLRRIGSLNQQLGEQFAKAALGVMQHAGIPPAAVTAIGSHGQTLWHEPNAALAFSTQLGCPNRLAARTGCTVVADFRNADMALGGQGAPLVPAFHHGLFAHHNVARIVVNIGGIANLTILPASNDRDESAVTGLDTGPGNALMDAWIAECTGQRMDNDGRWAASGHVHGDLLDCLLQDPYLARNPPKSTGREYFSRRWLQAHLDCLENPPEPTDVQATLCEFTARTIAGAIEDYGPGREDILVCGGGAHNQLLMNRLTGLLAPRTVATTSTHGIDADWVEAAAFAWLAKRRLEGLPGNLPGVTGASRCAILGGVYAPPSDDRPST